MTKKMEELLREFHENPREMKKKDLIQVAKHFQLVGYNQFIDLLHKKIAISPKLIESILREEYLNEHYAEFATSYENTFAVFKKILLEEAEKTTPERHYDEYEDMVSESIAKEALVNSFERMKKLDPVFTRRLEERIDANVASKL